MSFRGYRSRLNRLERASARHHARHAHGSIIDALSKDDPVRLARVLGLAVTVGVLKVSCPDHLASGSTSPFDEIAARLNDEHGASFLCASCEATLLDQIEH